MYPNTKMALLICGDKWTETSGPSLFQEFWHRPELSRLRWYEVISRDECLRRRLLHPWLGTVAVYGFYQVDNNPAPDLIDGLLCLMPFLKREWPGERKAFFLQITREHHALIRPRFHEGRLVPQVVCTIRSSRP